MSFRRLTTALARQALLKPKQNNTQTGSAGAEGVAV